MPDTIIRTVPFFGKKLNYTSAKAEGFINLQKH